MPAVHLARKIQGEWIFSACGRKFFVWEKQCSISVMATRCGRCKRTRAWRNRMPVTNGPLLYKYDAMFRDVMKDRPKEVQDGAE